MAMNRKRAEFLFHLSTFANASTYVGEFAAFIVGFWRFGVWRGLLAFVAIGLGSTLLRFELGIAFARWIGATDATFFE
jgi:hypothetical protein